MAETFLNYNSHAYSDIVLFIIEWDCLIMNYKTAKEMMTKATFLFSESAQPINIYKVTKTRENFSVFHKLVSGGIKKKLLT